MNSMTGFGSGSFTEPESAITFRTEISSVNKKQLEIKLSLPHELAALEPAVRSAVQARIARGQLSIRIETVCGPESAPQVDFSRLLPVYRAAKAFQTANGIPGEITISDLLAIPAMPAVSPRDYSDSRFQDAVLASLGSALDSLLRMRAHEGGKLSADLLSRIAAMESMLAGIEPAAAQLAGSQTQRLKDKIAELHLDPAVTADRILQEAVIYGDRYDVTEEITRLHCHFGHFRKIAADVSQPVGRSLDFLVQEIFRECNTLGTKASCPEISPAVVMLKTELEKIREQVQNIE